MVEPNITFKQLVYEIYQTTEINNNVFEIELSYKPNIEIDIVPIAIENDIDVMVLAYHNCSSFLSL